MGSISRKKEEYEQQLAEKKAQRADSGRRAKCWRSKPLQMVARLPDRTRQRMVRRHSEESATKEAQIEKDGQAHGAASWS